MTRARSFAVVVMLAVLAACRGGRVPERSAYIDAAKCAACHQKIYQSYQHVGMGQSFAVASQAHPMEDGRFLHAASGRRYEVFRRDARIIQRRVELDAGGKERNAFELEATHVVGSGHHARTYLHRSTNGEMTELPLTWYSQEKRWAMSPGFDNAAPPDFTRRVDDRCLFCHNAYPAADGSLASGIDCQRCHGPGARHVELASQGKTAKDAIVNPKRLDATRQLDVCLQCHLETTSSELPAMVRRFDRTAYSFRPGELLSDYTVQFDDGRAEKFEVVNQGYRMRQSACFLKSAGRLNCTSCHNPHDVVRGEAAMAGYRAQCRSCHATVAAAKHPDLATSNCISCHMPRRHTEDAVHVVMTDHRIQRRPAPEGKGRGGRPVLYYPSQLPREEQDAYLGVALIAGTRDRKGGIAMLDRQPEAPSKALAVLGEGYLSEGQFAKAISAFEQALKKDRTLSKARYNLGQALEGAGRFAEARVAYEQTRTALPEAEFALGNLLIKQGEAGAAVQHMEAALLARPLYPEALNALGSLHTDQGKLDEARKELEQALRIDPLLAAAHSNLGRVLAAQRQLPEALQHFRRAVTLDSGDVRSGYNLARLLHESGATAASVAEYRRVLARKPDFAEAHLGLGQTLGDAGQLDGAIVEFREVLRLRPGHAEAQQNLDMALSIKQGR